LERRITVLRPDFLTGAIDLHIHSDPDIIERVGSSIDIARDCARAGMRAIVFKDHVFPSFIKAKLTQQMVPEIAVFGGIALNGSVGGLYPYAVKGAINGGAKVIMFPTQDSVWNLKRDHLPLPQRQQAMGEQKKPIPVVGEDGKLVPAAEKILQIIAQYPEVILSNGHVGADETLVLFERARELGIKRLVVEHPNSNMNWKDEELLRAADLGAVAALSYNAYNPAVGKRDPAECVKFVRLLGPERCVLITDGGQAYSPRPFETMRFFSEMLFELGLKLDEIFIMTKITPARLLGLPEA